MALAWEDLGGLGDRFVWIDVQVADEDQNLWEEYTKVRDANAHFAMQKIVTPAQIFPVFRDLFKKSTTTA